jgi:hypothetical protein
VSLVCATSSWRGSHVSCYWLQEINKLKGMLTAGSMKFSESQTSVNPLIVWKRFWGGGRTKYRSEVTAEVNKTVIFLFCLGLKRCLSFGENNEDWGCSRTECWGEYLDVRASRKQASGENYLMRSFILVLFHHVLLTVIRSRRAR